MKMNTRKWMCVILMMAGLVGTNCVFAQTWSGGDMTWSQPDTNSFSSQYTSGSAVIFTNAGAGTVTIDPGGVTPGNISVNSSSAYTFTGGGIGGTGSLTKTGSGTLTLSNTNSFNGGVFINGGILTLPAGATAAHLGDSGNVVTFTGTSTLNLSTITLSQGFVIDAGVTATWGAGYATVTLTNSLAGSGTLKASGGGTSGGYYIFTSTNNPFSGNIQIYSYSNNSYPAGVTMVSLADSPGSRITLGNNASTVSFTYGADAVAPLVLSNRQIEFYANYEFPSTLYNNATNVNCTVTINTDLLVSRNSTITFGLGGSNTGNNTFAGAITNKIGYVTSLLKDNAGKWILAGPNTYTGTTTIKDGILEFASSGTYAGNISVTDTTPNPLTFSGAYTQTVSGVISGTMSLIKEGTGTLILTGANTHTNTMVNAGTLSLGNGTSSSSLYDFSTLSVASGAKVNLNFTGSEAVFYLKIDGSPAAAGTWGATGSGATNIDDTHFTGTGVIENLNGNTASIGLAFWDGGAADISTNGNAAGTSAAGTWNTTLKNWDYGFTAHAAWLNTTNAKAIFNGSENADRTVTVNGALNIKELSFETTGSAGTRYIIDGGTLNFGSGGVIRNSDNRYDQTITSAITGSPAVNIKDYRSDGANDTYKGLKFAPTNGIVTLGAVLNPDNTGNKDKSGITLAGTTTGNTIASINYAGGDKYADTIFQSGEWTVNGGIRTGNLKLFGGKLIVSGTIVSDNVAFSFTNGTLAGTCVVDEPVTVPASGTLAPGNPTGTMTITNNACTINGKLEININGSETGKLDMHTTQTLIISNATLNVNVAATPILPVTIVTYGAGKLAGTFASTNMPGGWTIDYVANGGKAIVLTPPPGGTLIFMK
jgi:autotransporter-associated beta strand protein